MSKNNFPPDLAEKILEMLKPRFRPQAVMVFKEGCDDVRAPHQRIVKMRPGTLTDHELSFLVGEKPVVTWEESKGFDLTGKYAWEDYIIKKEEKGILELNLHKAKVMDQARTAAMLLGFKYGTKKEGSILDVMYRDAYLAYPEFA